MKKLPKKLSKLLYVALNDLEEIEKDKNYQVDMEIWHSGL